MLEGSPVHCNAGLNVLKCINLNFKTVYLLLNNELKLYIDIDIQSYSEMDVIHFIGM